MATEGRPRKYSDAELLAPIREFAAEHGRPPTSKEYDDIATPSRRTLRNRFGSHANAVEAAGYDPDDISGPAVQSYSDAEVLAPIKAYVAEHGDPPTSNEYVELDGPSMWCVLDRFDGYHDAVEAAGYDPDDIPKGGSGPEYTEEELLTWIDCFVDLFGVVPSSNDFVDWPGPDRRTYRYRFGSVVAAVREAGYTPRGDR